MLLQGAGGYFSLLFDVVKTENLLCKLGRPSLLCLTTTNRDDATSWVTEIWHQSWPAGLNCEATFTMRTGHLPAITGITRPEIWPEKTGLD